MKLSPTSYTWCPEPVTITFHSNLFYLVLMDMASPSQCVFCVDQLSEPQNSKTFWKKCCPLKRGFRGEADSEPGRSAHFFQVGGTVQGGKRPPPQL